MQRITSGKAGKETPSSSEEDLSSRSSFNQAEVELSVVSTE